MTSPHDSDHAATAAAAPLPEPTENLGAPFLIGDLPGHRLIEEAGIERDGGNFVVPLGIVRELTDDAVEIEECDLDHSAVSAAAQHVEGRAGAEPGDVLVGHRVRGA